MYATDVKWLHVEASSRCNAWCPACPRNNNGFGLAPGVQEQDLPLEVFQRVVSKLPFLDAIQFCGNLGDPVASQYFMLLVEASKAHCKKIQIHTNGGLRNSTWWKNLAHALSDINHDVWFGIDGIGETHEIYRQGTSYTKVIENATAFINQGGNATWQFIPYQHNEHQIKECMKESQKLKFKKFHLAKLYRKQTLARNYRSGKLFPLLPSQSLGHLTNSNRIKGDVNPNNCMHLSLPSIYLSAQGYISRCCYFAKHEHFDHLESFFWNHSTDLSNAICIRNCA